jgi:hypothetical protein
MQFAWDYGAILVEIFLYRPIKKEEEFINGKMKNYGELGK